MKRILTVVIVIAVLGLVVVGPLVGSYNSLVKMNEDVNGKQAQVQVQLQRRFDLIPNLVATVKGYAAHEEKVFADIADARAKLAGASTPDQQIAAANQLEGALGRLLVVVENYPTLKADANFRALMDELAGTENRIAVERQRYNEAVRDFNARVKSFPTVIIARLAGFSNREYLQTPQEAQAAPQVDFK